MQDDNKRKTVGTENATEPEPQQEVASFKRSKSAALDMRNGFGLALIFISLGCLYPGITKPLLQIQVIAQLPLLGSLELYNETQSIVQSIRALWENQNRLVALLILLFSIVVPVVKALLLFAIFFLNRAVIKSRLVNFVRFIGKWSMADVFVVSVFMAFLATQSNDFLEAILHEGFYYFLAYCIISICASLIVRVPPSTQI